MAEAARPVARPISPHLLIYHPYATMVMSIVHRITGVALYAGTLLLAWWLVAAASGPAAFDLVLRVMGSIPGQVILFGYTWALLQHMLGGVRHLIWDTTAWMGRRERNLLAWGTLAGSAGLTVILWLISLLIR